MSFRTANFASDVTGMVRTQIRAAWPVAAQPIKAACSTVNWLLGRGVPLAVDGGYFWSGSDFQQRRLRYAFRVDSVHPVIGVYIIASSTAWALPVEIAGTDYLIGQSATAIHYAVPNLSGDGVVTMDIDIEYDGGPSGENVLFIHNVYIYESPMTIIDTDHGAGGVEPGWLIYDGYGGRESIAGLERAAEELRGSYFRRGTMFNWSCGIDDSEGGAGVQTTSTSYVELFPTGIKPALQARHMYSGETTRTVMAYVYAKVSGGTGNVRLSMTSGGSQTFPITATTGSWTNAGLAVETDDPARWAIDGGLRGGTRDELTVEFRAASGQSIDLYAIAIFDLAGL